MDAFDDEPADVTNRKRQLSPSLAEAGDRPAKSRRLESPVSGASPCLLKLSSLHACAGVERAAADVDDDYDYDQHDQHHDDD